MQALGCCKSRVFFNHKFARYTLRSRLNFIHVHRSIAIELKVDS